MKTERSDTGVYRLQLSTTWFVGFSPYLVTGFKPYPYIDDFGEHVDDLLDWTTYVWFQRYVGGSWHFRILWFYIGRKK